MTCGKYSLQTLGIAGEHLPLSASLDSATLALSSSGAPLSYPKEHVMRLLWLSVAELLIVALFIAVNWMHL